MKESYLVSSVPQSTTGLARAVFLCSLRNGQVGTALGKFLINLNDSEEKNQALANPVVLCGIEETR